MALANSLKELPEDSILEYLQANLKEIQSDKTWSNEDTGREFATILTRPVVKQIMNNDYYDEDDYGVEDYGMEMQQQSYQQ